MIGKHGRWHYESLLRELKAVDAGCGIRTDLLTTEGIKEGTVQVAPSDPLKEIALRAALNSHDADAALAAWIARQERISNAATEIKKIPGWATWTAQEAGAWLEANILNLESAKTVMKTMARIICHLRDHAGIIG